MFSTSIESIKEYQKRIMNIKSTLGIKTPSKYDEFNDPLIMREDLLGVYHLCINFNQYIDLLIRLKTKEYT